MNFLNITVGLSISIFVSLVSCTSQKPEKIKTSFADDVTFLKNYTDVVLLSDSYGKAKVAVLPAFQGRVMTSTATGDAGASFGWINRELIASGKTVAHINAYGGEDRFWIGPEGGQFSVFFKKGVPFDLEHWFTPAPIDTEPFDLVSTTATEVYLTKKIQLENYSGTVFNLRVDRCIRLLEPGKVADFIAMPPDDRVNMVAYESDNKMTNTGTNPWQKQTGLLSIWILGMYNPSPTTTIVIPFNQGPESELGPIVNDAYFGQVPNNRLVVKENVLYFSGDGQYRSKIGLAPERARSVLGSYDASNKVLTIVQYNKPEGAVDYVNSMWEIQEHPYRGDVVNSYNDGPPAPGVKPLGPFYELETSSMAAALAPNESIVHLHRTFHLQGPEPALDNIAKALLGVTIADITTALPQ